MKNKIIRSDIDPAKLIECAETRLQEQFREVDKVGMANHRRVLQSLQKNKLTEEMFAERTGYGHDDPGREAMDRIFADAFEAETAAVRMQFVSGTHAIAAALFGNLSYGDRLVSLTGRPYDTMLKVLGAPSEPGTLLGSGICYVESDFSLLNLPESERQQKIRQLCGPPCKIAYIQKSRGYSSERRSISVNEIGQLTKTIKAVNDECLVIVDNCYGEFVEAVEPTALGVDLIAGSMIKNPGGGLAISGGYVAGKEEPVQRALNRLTAPGIGGHLGLTFNQNRLIFQGLFMAPNVVAECVKGAMLVARVLEELDIEVLPGSAEPRFDIIQSIHFKSESRLLNFCRALQRCSPVNSHVTPEPSHMPGYADKVVMAGGSFIEGATIELSADGPLRPPYTGFFQGGLSYLHVKCVLQDLLNLSLSGVFPFVGP